MKSIFNSLLQQNVTKETRVLCLLPPASWRIRRAVRKKPLPGAERRRVPLPHVCCPSENNSCTSKAARGGNLPWEPSASPTPSSTVGLSVRRWSLNRPPSVQNDVPLRFASCSELCKRRNRCGTFSLLPGGVKAQRPFSYLGGMLESIGVFLGSNKAKSMASTVLM